MSNTTIYLKQLLKQLKVGDIKEMKMFRGNFCNTKLFWIFFYSVLFQHVTVPQTRGFHLEKLFSNSGYLSVRFSLDLDIAAPKITIPTDFCPDNTHATKLLLDLGNLMIRTQVDTPDNFCNVFFFFLTFLIC